MGEDSVGGGLDASERLEAVSKRHQNAASLMVKVAAPEMVGDTHLERYIGTEMAKNEAKALRRASVKLRKEAKKQRNKTDGAGPNGLAANILDGFADDFLHEAQAIEKASA